jgi:probable rRNA maturation factor
MIETTISNQQEAIEITDGLLAQIEKVIQKVMEIEEISREGELSLTIVDETTIKDLNREYRGKDEVTDVLSFPQYDEFLSIKDEMDYLVIGDVVICAQRAKEQADDFGHSYSREFAYLVVHSLYHLFGFDHMNEDDKKIMREKEEAALSELGINR